jgi:rhodanese-related sulfurtransferase
MMTGIPELTPREVKRMMEEKQPFVLIDVREPHEFQMKTHIPCRILRKEFLTPNERLGARLLVVSSDLRCICT